MLDMQYRRPCCYMLGKVCKLVLVQNNTKFSTKSVFFVEIIVNGLINTGKFHLHKFVQLHDLKIK